MQYLLAKRDTTSPRDNRGLFFYPHKSGTGLSHIDIIGARPRVRLRCNGLVKCALGESSMLEFDRTKYQPQPSLISDSVKVVSTTSSELSDSVITENKKSVRETESVAA